LKLVHPRSYATLEGVSAELLTSRLHGYENLQCMEKVVGDKVPSRTHFARDGFPCSGQELASARQLVFVEIDKNHRPVLRDGKVSFCHIKPSAVGRYENYRCDIDGNKRSAFHT